MQGAALVLGDDFQRVGDPLGELQIVRTAALGPPALQRLGAHAPALRQFAFRKHPPLVRPHRIGQREMVRRTAVCWC